MMIDGDVKSGIGHRFWFLKDYFCMHGLAAWIMGNEKQNSCKCKENKTITKTLSALTKVTAFKSAQSQVSITGVS